MKKALLISNVATCFTNFIIPSIKNLNELGYEVHTCANYTGFYDDKSKYNVKMHQIDFIRNPFNPKNIKAYKQLLKLMKQEKFDLVHCNTPIGGLLGRICARKTKVLHVVYTAHGFHFYKGAPLINQILYKGMEKHLAKHTDILITMNKEDYNAAHFFKLRNNGKVKLVHGVGIDIESLKLEKFDRDEYRRKLNLTDKEVMIISAGDLIKRKNYECSIKAIAECHNKNIHYFICGKGPLESDLKKLSENLNVQNQIHFLGYRKDMKELMKSADIFLFTTIQEGLPRSLMEAMAIGLPCVVSNIRGNVDLIDEGKGGFLCEAMSPKDFASKIKLLIDEPNIRETMKKINIQNSKQYDITCVKKEIKEIYEEILI